MKVKKKKKIQRLRKDSQLTHRKSP
ncbi:hypothetical protein OIU74_028174 [Salix koriyanagi]|uniref:Uncharacterized protein n=1 Tax=Salix koriyanagi TaxID=2511006 RepID=A0A9Q0ZSK8_9ROSI|nr:hypothetical protein OIU74_028174 [Salix koriyanagi]